MLSPVTPHEIFTPGSFPEYTYVERSELRLEKTLENALNARGKIVSIAGPSKLGKTVLVEHVVPPEKLITITGANIGHHNELWEKILDALHTPVEEHHSKTTKGDISVSGDAKGSINVPFVADAGASVSGGTTVGKSSQIRRSFRRSGMRQAVEELMSERRVVLIDDFHYVSAAVQEQIAKQIKEAARLGAKIIVSSAANLGDEIIRSNPELRGRLTTLDFEYWEEHHLSQIAIQGFRELKTGIASFVRNDFIREAAGSPQLMQAICLSVCELLTIEASTPRIVRLPIGPDILRGIYHQTASSIDFRRLIEVFLKGPKVRGTPRKQYKLIDRRSDFQYSGDVYTCLLRCVALNPSQFTFAYSDLLDRIGQICIEERPTGASVIDCCKQMSKLAKKTHPTEDLLEWDDELKNFTIHDPYLLFYLRWSQQLDKLTLKSAS